MLKMVRPSRMISLRSLYVTITQQLSIPAGYHTLNLSLGHLATGTYFLRVDGRASGTVKIFKMGGTLQGVAAGPSLSVSPGRKPDRLHGAVPVRASDGTLSVEGYFLKVKTDRYDTFESAFSLSELRSLAVPMSRNNEVEFIVTDQQNQSLTLLLNVDGGSGTFSVATPGKQRAGLPGQGRTGAVRYSRHLGERTSGRRAGQGMGTVQ